MTTCLSILPDLRSMSMVQICFIAPRAGTPCLAEGI